MNATIWHHLEKHTAAQPELVSKLLRSTYVDDIVTGADSEEAAYRLYKESKELLQEAGFNLRKFSSNSSHLRDKIQKEETPHAFDVNPNPPVLNNMDESEETYTRATLGGSQTLHSGEQKILGVKWNVDTDQFVVSLEEIARIAESK